MISLDHNIFDQRGSKLKYKLVSAIERMKTSWHFTWIVWGSMCNELSDCFGRNVRLFVE